MNFFEELGSGLGSLSLHDHQKWSEDVHQDDLYDLMDIDTPLDNLTLDGNQTHNNGSKHTIQTQKPHDFTVEQLLDDEDGHTVSLHLPKARAFEEDDRDDPEKEESFLGILSPTALGARYALQPQKLLMAPEHVDPPSRKPSRKPSIDFEVDTCEMQSSKEIARTFQIQTNNSTFFDKGNDIFQTDPHTGNINNNTNNNGWGRIDSQYLDQNLDLQPKKSIFSPDARNLSYNSGMFGTSLFNSNFPERYLQRPQTIVHHHHYYTESNSGLGSSEKVDTLSSSRHQKEGPTSLSTDLQQMSFEPKNHLQKYDNYIDSPKESSNLGSLVSYRSNVAGEGTVYYPNGHIKPYLPSPWDPRAVPAERLPYVLLSYFQLLANTLLSAFALHILVAMVQAVRSDVSSKMALEANSLLVEIALCLRAYRENNCDPSDRVPALEQMCDYWEKCMTQDPSQIGNRSLIGAHTLGVILNSLIEPLGLKFLSVGAFFVILLFACNFAFGYIRARAYYGMNQVHPKQE